MSELYSDIKKAIIQIATPFGTGTGFYLHDYNLIVTNLHLTSRLNEVVISGNHFPKTMASVIYRDPIYDLAFIEAPESVLLAKLKLGNINSLNEGDSVTSIGQAFGSEFSATKSVINKLRVDIETKNFIQIDVSINSKNNGGPLINENNEIIGVNNSSIVEGKIQGFALSVDDLKKALEEYKPQLGKFALRCNSCSNIITDENIEAYICKKCGTKIAKEDFDGKKYIPSPGCEKIEEIIRRLNYEVPIARTGQNYWEIEKGSALICIKYEADYKYIKAYAVLCKLPKDNIG